MATIKQLSRTWVWYQGTRFPLGVYELHDYEMKNPSYVILTIKERFRIILKTEVRELTRAETVLYGK